MDKSFKRWILIILLISAFFRVGYFLFGDVAPVMWDARRYSAAALGLISYVDDEGAGDFKNEREDRYRFKYYYDKYINGEKIDWQSYTPHNLTQARDDNFYGGPLYPLTLAAIFYATPSGDFTVARIFNIVLDLLSTLLIMLVAFRLIGRRGAIISGFIYAFYFPFALMATMILLETSTTFYMLLALYLLFIGDEKDKLWYFILSGLVAGLLILNKPTATFIFIPFAIGYFFIARKRSSGKLLNQRLLMFSFLPIMILLMWLFVTYGKYDKLTLRDPAYVETIEKQSSSIEFEGYDLDSVEKGFQQQTLTQALTSDPVGYIKLLAKKFDRLWSRPYNDFKRSFIIPYQIGEWMHLLIVIFGFTGILFLLARNFNYGVLLFLIVAYYSAIHLMLHSLSRYNINAMPFLIIAAAYLLAMVSERVKNHRGVSSAVIYLILVALVIITSPLGLISYSGIAPGALFVWLVVILQAVVVGFLIYKLLSSYLTRAGMFKKIIIPILICLVVIDFGWARSISRHEWAEFSCRLDSDKMKAGTRIYIDKLAEPAEGEIIAAVVDMNNPSGVKNPFILKAGSFVGEYMLGEEPLVKLFYPKPGYLYQAKLEHFTIDAYRQYAIVPLDVERLKADLAQTGYIDLEISFNDLYKEQHFYLNLYGNYASNVDPSYIPGVRFTAMERYIDKGDPRIRYPIKFSSKNSVSYYITRKENKIESGGDLSPSGGQQIGRYNMFLIHFKKNGDFLVY